MKSFAKTSPVLLGLMVFGATLPTIEGAKYLRGLTQSGRTVALVEGDRAVTQIVKLLKTMLEDSQKEGDEEKTLYEKFKCYCDDNTEEKTKSVKDLTKEIGLLRANIEELQGSTGLLSKQTADLKAEMDKNEQTREEAKELRKDEKEAFEKTEKDLKEAIGQLKTAVDILADVGADQNLEESAEHERFMAGYNKDKEDSLLKLKASVKQALLAARTVVTPQQRQKALAFIQGPFAGSYSSQSGEIFGILSNMKETFETNLKTAEASEKAAIAAHEQFMKTKEEDFDTMKKSYDSKQSTMSDNDDGLGDKKTLLEEAERQLEEDEAFLEKLTPMCEKKSEEFEKRNAFRVQEHAAITQAIAILDNDKAFKTFGEVKATGSEGKTGFFLQISAAVASPVDDARRSAMLSLLRAPRRSARLMRVAALLSSGNAFTKVLESIEKMKELIVEEAKVDKEQFDFCKEERKENNDKKDEKKEQIEDLESGIAELEKSIDDPETGLKAMIAESEESLEENSKSQSDETKARREENLLYQKSVSNTADAVEMLQMGLAALEKFYDDLKKKEDEDLELVQRREDPEPPKTWEEGSFKGQSESGNKVIGMIKFVLESTEKEEAAHHDGEQKAQADYEDSMAELKEAQGELQESLVKTKGELAEAEKTLVMKRQSLEKTERERLAIEQYLEKLKPGCDFITDNFETREKNRETETEALDKAAKLLKGTSAYASAKAAEKEEGFGKCKETCLKTEPHADCQACLADVSVPGYCAGHPDTPGC